MNRKQRREYTIQRLDVKIKIKYLIRKTAGSIALDFSKEISKAGTEGLI